MKLSSPQFYHMLDLQLSFQERIHFLLTADYDFQDDWQPDAIIQRFMGYIETYEQALVVANVFKQRFGNTIVICRESSACEKRMITLLDELLMNPKQYLDVHANGYYRIVCALHDVGFKRADECNYHLLWHFYSMDMYYYKYFTFPYDYKSIRDEKLYLHRDLIEFHYHPQQIQKWLNANPNKHIEDYLQ